MASRHEPGPRRAARPRCPVPDEEAFARVLSELRRTGVAARIPGNGRPGWRSDARPSAVRRARLATAPADPRARATAGAGRLANPYASVRSRSISLRMTTSTPSSISRRSSAISTAPRSRDSSRKHAVADLTTCRECLASFITGAQTRAPRAAEPIPSGSRRRAHRRVPAGGATPVDVRSRSAGDDGYRRAALLHQQSPASQRLSHAQRHPRSRRRPDLKVRLKPTPWPPRRSRSVRVFPGAM